jgi:anthranilate synthase component 1
MPPEKNIQAIKTFDQYPAVIQELPADLETPVSVYLKLAGTEPSFLLESISGGENLARYSFIGVQPRGAFILRNGEMEICMDGQTRFQAIDTSKPLDCLRQHLANPENVVQPAGLPRFHGGLVGYLGYEMMRFFEKNVPLEPYTDLPDAIFLLADTLVAFDHAFGKILLIVRYRTAEDVGTAHQEALKRLKDLRKRLDGPIPMQRYVPSVMHQQELSSNMTRTQYHSAVERAKEHITAGDAFQIVLSQRLSRGTEAEAFSIYRALRSLNPSPYMFFFNFGKLAGEPGLQLIGASPELHVRLEKGQAAVRPIAGTRPRSAQPLEDLALEQELLADPKERAEHVMLVDLARNDLGRVCEYGSVDVPEQMVVERYSHVMHIVSEVTGRLKSELDAFDLMQATFPAGTVSGAPKIRAMQIIDQLEKDPRGVYAGAVGYFAMDGSMDTCIAIRTMVMRGKQISVQAGAGIVADSDPEKEYQESLNKARALAVAVEMAETNAVFSRPLQGENGGAA